MSYFNRLLPVMAGHELCFWVDEDRARELLRSGQCRLIRRRGRDRVLQAAAGIRELPLAGQGTAFHGTRYSHNRETETNPSRVWTHVRQPSPAPFGRVIAECSVCMVAGRAVLGNDNDDEALRQHLVNAFADRD